jgi:hypothetical protein
MSRTIEEGSDMPATKEDLHLLLEMEQTLKPSSEAKKFAWSSATKEGEGWFDRYPWDSDERMYVNEYSTYFELYGLAWKQGLLDEELVLDWVPAVTAWEQVAPVLLEARRVLQDDELWTNFEALAQEQARRDSA